MVKIIFRNKVWSGIILGLTLALLSTDAFARGESRRIPSRSEVVVVKGSRYHYRDGKFYWPGFFGLDFFVVAPPIGAIVRALPFGYNVIVAGGSRYYHYNNIYYADCPSGYLVVPVSAVYQNVVTVPPVTQYQGILSETITINVPNTNGSYTSVALVRRNNGYVGPQGEYYPEHPSIEQLKVLYGK
ncbi:MAG: DUF6515 family protein [Candidatus Omnitrophota bacterium]|nr:hypothetical protein [Candidatus Omnitrophota bacterium]MBU1929052.1 hypothetical protein [Candidatus Omnitrophota bacterium]